MEPLIVLLVLVTLIVHAYSTVIAVATLVIGTVILYLIHRHCDLSKWTNSRLYAHLMGSDVHEEH